MCLAIYKPKGVVIPKAYYHNGYIENHDGCGFAFAYNGKIECLKGFRNFKDFWKAIKPLQSRFAMLIHFRWATHGDKSDNNVHPILVNKGKIAVIHNGVIPIQTYGNDSDTVTFARDVLGPSFRRFTWQDATLRYLVETSIGKGNKIVAMNAQGKVVIFNEDSGHWHKGAWYSNSGYEGESRWAKWSGYASQCYRNYVGASYPKTYTPTCQQTVFDEIDSDEIEAEAVAQQHEANSLDYDGKSHHSKPLIPLHYKTTTLRDGREVMHVNGTLVEIQSGQVKG